MVSKQSNLSNSESMPDLTMKEDVNFIDLSAKKCKLSASADGLLSAESHEGMIETRNHNPELLGLNYFNGSLEEFVFSIDHILELIFEKCDKGTLLNSRLVSCRWAYFGSKELQKTVVIRFCKSYTTSEAPPRFRLVLGATRLIIDDLITLMNNSPEFPSTSFEFRSDPQKDTCNETAQEFFNAHGASVKKLFFYQHLYMEDLRHLLLNQAPNLQHLYLGPIEILSKNPTDALGLFDKATLKSKPVLNNLKVFKCHFTSDMSKKFIKQILYCSPNLIDVALPSSRLDLLVYPINRVHLLKKMKIDTNSCSVESLEIFADLFQQNKNLAVREIYVVSGQYEHEEEDSQELLYDAVEDILKGCSATCLKLVWLAYLFNFKIPKMPQVQHLTIEYSLHEDYDTPINNLTSTPVNGVSLGDTFPNLKYLEVRTMTEMGNLPLPNIFNDVNPLPAANVKTVTLRLRGHGEEVVGSFQKMFPNSSIHDKVELPGDIDGFDSEEEWDEDDTEVC